MSNLLYGDSIFTKQIKALLARLYGRSSLKDSVVDRAMSYYNNRPLVEHKLTELSDNLTKLHAQVPTDAGTKRIKLLEREQRQFLEQLADERHERYSHLYNICEEILECCESYDFDETNRKSAQVLGTIQLVSQTEGKRVADANEINKPLYKGVLSLRLLDRLCLDKTIAEPYISQRLGSVTPETYNDFAQDDPEGYQQFVQQVKIPLLMAALLQDIGNNHPDAQRIILAGGATSNRHRTLQVEERKKLLQISYRETIQYFTDGIGVPRYVGNSKVERDRFIKVEQEKLLFIRFLLKSAVKPRESIGNVIKVPQIYTSIVMSTKASYNYKLLPKVFQALNENAKRGACSQHVVDALLRITGFFPQGYGVTYIPEDLDKRDRYEYAIVSRLYPESPEQPICRTATRNLAFMSRGYDFVLKEEHNLYFTATAKKFATISRERLNEILELLASNYLERQQLDLLPRCWHPSSFFSQKKHQKLWTKGSG